MNVEIRRNDNNERCLYATRKISKGCVIFEEKPLVCCQFSWNAAYGYSACDHCMRPLETAEENARRLTNNPNLVLPFPECCDIRKDTIVACSSCEKKYCSEMCKSTAYEQYHRLLCVKDSEQGHPLIQLNEAWKQMNYPPETGTIMLIARMIALVDQSPDPASTAGQFLQFCHQAINKEQQLHKLLGDRFIDQIDLLLSLTQSAFPSTSFGEWLTPDGFRSLLALVGRNAQGVGTTSVGKWVRRCLELQLPADQETDKLTAFIDRLYEELEKESGPFLDNEGCALYLLQSACNHSCAPNAQAGFHHNDSTLVMMAERDIEAGEEVFISYLSPCDLERSRHSRRKNLLENYLFECSCDKCLQQADEPDVTSEEEMSDEGEDTDAD